MPSFCKNYGLSDNPQVFANLADNHVDNRQEAMMDISSVANASAALSQANTGDAVAIMVLKKAIDIQAQSALQLIQALPQATANNPPNLGQNINVFA